MSCREEEVRELQGVSKGDIEELFARAFAPSGERRRALRCVAASPHGAQRRFGPIPSTDR